MKKTIFILFFVFTAKIFSQSGWIPQIVNVDKSSFYGIRFLDTQTGWACGYGGTFKTTNNGLSWYSIGSIGVSIDHHGVYFINQNTGFIIARYQLSFPPYTNYAAIYGTVNGGANWIMRTTEINSWSLLGLDFINDLTGYAVGCDGLILKTTNMGFDWFSQISNTYHTLN